jgi:hypothetical protein
MAVGVAQALPVGQSETLEKDYPIAHDSPPETLREPQRFPLPSIQSLPIP